MKGKALDLSVLTLPIHLYSNKLVTQSRQLRQLPPALLPAHPVALLVQPALRHHWLERELDLQPPHKATRGSQCHRAQGMAGQGRQMHTLCLTHSALTGHHTMLRPARKNPPTVPRLVEYIACNKGKKEVLVIFQVC